MGMAPVPLSRWLVMVPWHPSRDTQDLVPSKCSVKSKIIIKFLTLRDIIFTLQIYALLFVSYLFFINWCVPYALRHRNNCPNGAFQQWSQSWQALRESRHFVAKETGVQIVWDARAKPRASRLSPHLKTETGPSLASLSALTPTGREAADPRGGLLLRNNKGETPGSHVRPRGFYLLLESVQACGRRPLPQHLEVCVLIW